jgi:hypothetical protein
MMEGKDLTFRPIRSGDMSKGFGKWIVSKNSNKIDRAVVKQFNSNSKHI